MNRYRVAQAPSTWPEALPFRVSPPGHDADYGVGEEFDHEFTVEQELENLSSGLLEIVPREYRVVAEDTVVYDTPTGGTFTAALLIEPEAALLGSHIERVEPARKTPAKKTTNKTPAKEANT